MPLLKYTGMNMFTVNCVGCDPVRLMPGINEVSDNALECMRKHPFFNARVKDETIAIMHENKPGPDGKRTIADMLQYIPKIFDVKLLKKIISEDGRDAVVNAAKDQLSVIKTPTKAKEDE
jgi:hypothetical protein